MAHHVDGCHRVADLKVKVDNVASLEAGTCHRPLWSCRLLQLPPQLM